MTAKQIIDRYIAFFEKRGHKQIANAPLIPENDPTTLFTSSGMQPLVPYLLGEKHPAGKRLVNVQNSFRAQDIEEIGDNRHTTFFRMIGNWSLGDYFKKEQISWFFQFLTDKQEGLGLDPKKLFITVFGGNETIPKDEESIAIWKKQFKTADIIAEENDRIFSYGVEKNWWSRAGIPDNMPAGEPGGPDTEVFYDFETPHDKKFGEKCHVNCDCGRYVEIGNSVFMQYIKQSSGSFKNLPQQNVDFGGGLERLVAATEHNPDVFQTSLFKEIIESVERESGSSYQEFSEQMRIITDHLLAGVMIVVNGIYPSNKEHGYILRRLLRRAFDNLYLLNCNNVKPILESIVEEYKTTDEYLVEKFETIKDIILVEEQKYEKARIEATKTIKKKYLKEGDELKGVTEISAEDAFILYTTHGLSPTQIKSLGYVFNDQQFASLMEKHQKISRSGALRKFAGGLADHSEKTIMGHTATHLLHQALRDVLGHHVHQTGSNITAERVRFDFNYDVKLTDEQIKIVERIVNEKIGQNLPVRFEMMPLNKAKELGAIGLFDEKYGDRVKIYFIGDTNPYSVEFCGGPHVDFTGKIKRFNIVKEEGLGKGTRRIYAKVV